jgi:hypothetical protein
VFGIATKGYMASWSVGHMSAFSLAPILAYAVTMRTIFRAERRGARPQVATATAMGLRQALGGYPLAAIVIDVAGIWLPSVGVQLARIMGWSDSLVDTLFIVLATSTPELATTLAAVRMGAIDLALGNILGSNLFDLLIVAMDDIAYVSGSIFQGVSTVHVVSLQCAALMNVAVIVTVRAILAAFGEWRTARPEPQPARRIRSYPIRCRQPPSIHPPGGHARTGEFPAHSTGEGPGAGGQPQFRPCRLRACLGDSQDTGNFPARRGVVVRARLHTPRIGFGLRQPPPGEKMHRRVGWPSWKRSAGAPRSTSRFDRIDAFIAPGAEVKRHDQSTRSHRRLRARHACPAPCDEVCG